LSSGPLQTGIRTFGHDGVFAVGNAAAEAHPIVAEGISMAVQSSALLCEHLVARPQWRGESHPSPSELEALRSDYAQAWRRNFARRLHVAALFAHLFMRPASTRLATAVLERLPQLLTAGAHWSGKAEALRGGGEFHRARS
jgi:flavin-dependent dehydrogenase